MSVCLSVSLSLSLYIYIYIFISHSVCLSLHVEGRFSVLPSGELHIRDVRDRDAGQYRCTVRNRLTNNNKVSPPAVLHVAGKSINTMMLSVTYTLRKKGAKKGAK